MEISVRQINIKPKFVKSLLTSGIVLVSHLNGFSASKLAQKTRLNLEECEEILTAIKPKRPHYVIKASELMVKPFDKLNTSIESLDATLGGGIRCGQITEISGEAGAGKSNLAAQVAILLMLPFEDGGSKGNVLLIHTEGEGKLKLTIKRFSTLAADNEQLIQRNLHVINCGNEFELVEMINRLSETLDNTPQVKLIIIDSMTCAFIQTDDNNLDYTFYAKRNRRLTQIVKTLAQLAWDRRLAIIVTNHVSYNVKLGETRPAMGKQWSHMCQTRIYLERKNTSHGVVRFAYVTKGAINTPSIAQFRISDRIQN